MANKSRRRAFSESVYRDLSLPEPPSRQVGVTSSGYESKITLLSKGDWVRFSDYVPVKVREELYTDIVGPGHQRQSVFIGPAKGADLEVLHMETLLDKLVPFLGNRFAPLLGDMVKQAEAYETEGDEFPPHSACEELATDLVLEGTRSFGPLGVRFTGIQGFYSNKKDLEVRIKDYQGKYSTVEEHFGSYLSRKISLKLHADGDLRPLFRAYREPVYEYCSEAFEYASWIRYFIDLPSTDASLNTATNILLRSRPMLLDKDGILSLSFNPSSLIDAAYIHAINRRLAGHPFRICGNEACRNVYLPYNRRHEFCSPDCASVIRLRKWRKNKEGKGQ